MSEREENKDGAATGEQVSLEDTKEDRSPNEENKEEPKEVKEHKVPLPKLEQAAKAKGFGVRYNPNIPTTIFLRKKPLEK